MPARGFCEHGKVWTTCAICGKDVIAAQAGKRGSAGLEDLGEPRPKKRVVKAPPEEPAEDAAAEETPTED